MSFVSIQELFCRSVERWGEQPAIETADGRSFSFEDLEKESNRLANFLRDSGTSRGSKIVIAINDTPRYVIGLLGVLKAGGVFVPVDMDHPWKRLHSMIGQVGPDWIITDSEFLSVFESLRQKLDAEWRVICPDVVDLDDDLIRLEDYASGSDFTRPPMDPKPDDPCYVFFTSGSTGTPKGIIGRLKGIDHFIRWEIETFDLHERIRVGQLVAPTFDAVLRDVFVPLIAGGTLCVPHERQVTFDPVRLAAWIDTAGIELIHCVPTIFRGLLDARLTAERFADLSHVFLSGEVLVGADVRRWCDIFGDRVRLINLYGPSETTMTKFFYEISSVDQERQRIPIGKPMKGAAALVVDSRNQPRSRDQAGEIIIRTPYRSLGYLQAELNQDVFISNPITGDESDLVYKTGDLGRVLADGNFDFLGRKDQQVKIRGVRIELEEIEAVLRNELSLREAVAVARQDSSGSSYLCAYIIIEKNTDLPQKHDYRSALSRSLPEYMIPSFFIEMEDFPRTLTGKVNRRELPMPSEMIGRKAVKAKPPRTQTEELLCEIFKDVLRLDGIGIHDSFFEWGGHSILATQVLSRIRKIFNVEVPLGAIFRDPTVAGLARATEDAVRLSVGRNVPDLVPRSPGAAIPVSFAQERLLFMEQLQPGTPFYTISTAALLTGPLDVIALNRAFMNVVVRHEALRTVFAIEHEEPIQIVLSEDIDCEIQLINVEVIVATFPDTSVEDWARKFAQASFDLQVGPLVFCRIVRLSSEEHILIVAMHHIISDGQSVGIFIDEMVTAYGNFTRGESLSLPEVPIQYGDFVSWHRSWLKGDVLAEELEYWRRQLVGSPREIKIPADRPRPLTRSFRGGRQSFVVDQDRNRRVEAYCREHGLTLFMLWLAVFDAFLYCRSGEEDILVGSPVSYRNWKEIEKAIGFFTNLIVLRIRIDPDSSFEDLARLVFSTSVDAFSHQDVPFDQIVNSLGYSSDLSMNPLFQVGFALQQGFDILEQEGDLLIESFDFGSETAQFDLDFHIVVTAEEHFGVFQFSRDLFDDSTIAEMRGQLMTVLDRVLDCPDVRLRELRAGINQVARDHWRERAQEIERGAVSKLRQKRRKVLTGDRA